MSLSLSVLVLLAAALALAACSNPHQASPTSAGSIPETIHTPGGLALDARLFRSHGPGANNTHLAILLHEFDENQSDWYPFARALADSGAASALTFDFRGYGASQGKRSTGEGLVTDAVAAVAFARGLGYRSIVLVGASMGGTAAIIAASEESGIDGVIAVSPAAQFGGMDAVQALRDHAPRELALIASEGDISALDSLQQLNAVARLPSNRVLIYSGNGHGTALFTSHLGETVTHDVETLLDAMWTAPR